jgi:uncharacterized protein YbaR (Trm112 family)
MTENNGTQLPLSADLLAILRDPLAVQDKETYGPDPGQLELVHNCWLVSKDTGYKYPIKDGIPVMLIEEGEKWKDTHINDLPVPPPPLLDEAPPMFQPQATGEQSVGAEAAPSPLLYLVPLAIGLGVLWLLWRILKRKT